MSTHCKPIQYVLDQLIDTKAVNFIFSILCRESIRENLIRNLENLRSVHRRLSSSVTNDRYYEVSTDSLEKSCRAHKLSVRPLRAKNINGSWKVIANIDKLFEQTITLTKCRY